MRSTTAPRSTDIGPTTRRGCGGSWESRRRSDVSAAYPVSVRCPSVADGGDPLRSASGAGTRRRKRTAIVAAAHDVHCTPRTSLHRQRPRLPSGRASWCPSSQRRDRNLPTREMMGRSADDKIAIDSAHCAQAVAARRRRAHRDSRLRQLLAALPSRAGGTQPEDRNAEEAREVRDTARSANRWLSVVLGLPHGPDATANRVIDRTVCCRMDRAFYDSCLDRRELRPQG